MKPADILRSYTAIAKAYHLQPVAWLKLLIIASHEEKGCRASAVCRIGGSNTNYRFVHQLAQRGLVTVSDVPHTTRPVCWVTITAQGLQALALHQPSAA